MISPHNLLETMWTSPHLTRGPLHTIPPDPPPLSSPPAALQVFWSPWSPTDSAFPRRALALADRPSDPEPILRSKAMSKKMAKTSMSNAIEIIMDMVLDMI